MASIFPKSAKTLLGMEPETEKKPLAPKKGKVPESPNPPATNPVATPTGEKNMAIKEIKASEVLVEKEIKKEGKERGFRYYYLLNKTGKETDVHFSKMALTMALDKIRMLVKRMEARNSKFDANEAFTSEILMLHMDALDILEANFPLVASNPFDYFNSWFPEGEKTISLRSEDAVKGFSRESDEYKLVSILNVALQYISNDECTTPMTEVVEKLQGMLSNQATLDKALAKLAEYEGKHGRDTRKSILSGGKEVANTHFKAIFMRKR